MKHGIFLNYQMVEAINLIECTQDRTLIEEELRKLKNRWLVEDEIPGYKTPIGNKMPGMQDLTIEDIYALKEQAEQSDTYTVQNCAAMQYCIQLDVNGKFVSFDFTRLEEIKELARKNGKKLIIDSAVVFGDLTNNNLKNLTKEELQEVIRTYIRTLTTKFGEYIERIDIFNAVFQRGIIDENNSSEVFWEKLFDGHYPEKIIELVRENINRRYKDNIKLCWNEFYLTNPKYKERKDKFLNMIKDLDIDCIGIQDRFTTSATPEYIKEVLNEIIKVCNKKGKQVCITEFSCTAGGYDRENTSIDQINKKASANLNAAKKTAQDNPTVVSVEGPVSDKYDYNHHELINHEKNPIDISTTGKKELLPVKQPELNQELNSMFTEESPSKSSNQEQTHNHEKNKIKTLEMKSNNGFTNYILLLISCIICIVIIGLLLI